MYCNKSNRYIRLIPCLVGVVLVNTYLTGCATSPPEATMTQALPKEHIIDKGDSVSVTVHSGSNVAIQEFEKQRLSDKIKSKVNQLKAANGESGKNLTYEIDVNLKQYEKGNAFARAMLAGLGQIHIDADVAVFTLPDRTKQHDFEISKTFAWGGIYGGVTTIENVEDGFAEGVAVAVTNNKPVTTTKSETI